MPAPVHKSHLTSLRDEIASLRVFRCRMAHERVVGEAAPAPPGSRGAPHNFVRVGLCAPSERDGRLGCSHTMARTRLDRAIRELEPEKAERLGHELNWLTNEIHLLDHRKGEAEARLASARRRGGAGASESLKEAEEVARLERLHDEYVERVGALRDRVVSEIERMLGGAEP